MKPKAPTLPEIKQWTRWFAIEHNNRAWELAELPERPAELTREMLDTAHAAALHWSRVGTAVHTMRANQLLAWVYALTGDTPRAGGYAKDCRSAIAADPEGLRDWDTTFQTLVDAIVARGAGDVAGHEAAAERATTARATLADPQDRKIFDGFAKQAGITF